MKKIETQLQELKHLKSETPMTAKEQDDVSELLEKAISFLYKIRETKYEERMKLDGVN